jgi:hypothetical protein
MSLSDLWNNLTREKAFTTAAFRIAPDRVLRTDTSRETTQFIPRATYFEVRLSQMFIQYQREYWREFIPMASMMTEFIFDGTRTTVPIIVGPERLASAQQVARGDMVEYYNTRIAGPYPYQGDDISLFAGLFRIEVNNWAKRTLSLFETVAEAFDPTRLSSYLNIARPLLTGLEGFLGMKEVEMRVGRQKAYMQQGSGAVPPDDASSDVLQPAFEVHIRAEASRFPPAERRKFWVYESRLHYGDKPDNLRPFNDADFMLLRFVPLATRNDFVTFDFHKTHWKQVETNLAEGKEDEARQEFKMLAVALAQSPDIVDAQKRLLAAEYKKMFVDARAAYQNFFNLDDVTREATPAAPAAPPPMRDADVQRALEIAATASVAQAAPVRAISPEQLLKQLEV